MNWREAVDYNPNSANKVKKNREVRCLSVEQKIQIAVARIDLFIVRYGLLIATIGIILFVVILCLIFNERK